MTYQDSWGQVPKKKSKWPWIAAAVAVLGLLCCGGVFLIFRKTATAATTRVHTVRYEVSGTTASSISFATGGGISQVGQTDLPFSKEVTVEGMVAVSLTAQTANTMGGISCRIVIDGQGRPEQHSDGAYAVVSCSAALL